MTAVSVKDQETEQFYMIETTLALIREVAKELKVNVLDENTPIDDCDSHTLRKIATITANLSTLLVRRNKDARLLQLFQQAEELKGLLETIIKAYAGNEKLKKWLLTLHSAKTTAHIDEALYRIITRLDQWKTIIEQKYGTVGEGNEHLETLPQPADQDTFYVMVKELRPGTTLFFSQPVNPLQAENVRRQRTSVLLAYDSRRPIIGTRKIRPEDTGKAPGSLIIIYNGHHRIHEIIRRYLRGDISGETLVQIQKG